MITENNKDTLDYLDNLIGKKLTFGHLLLSIRQGEGWTQTEMSKMLGVTRQYICDLEHERRFLSPRTAILFADKLGYSKHQFVRLCFQDILNRENIPMNVDIHDAA